MSGSVELTAAGLEQLLALAKRSHDGSLIVEPAERDGLFWTRVTVLLTDMGDVPPLHTFYMDPRGRLRP